MTAGKRNSGQDPYIYLGSTRLLRSHASVLALGIAVILFLATVLIIKYVPGTTEVTQTAVAPPQVEIVAIPETVDPTLPMSVQLEVRPGDTLLNMLTDSNVAYNEAHDVVEAVKKIYNPKSLNVGQNLSLSLDRNDTGAPEPQVSALDITVSPLKTIKLTRGPKGEFRVTQVNAPLFKKLARAGGTIKSSLYETGMQSGISAQALSNIINAFSYDVDFQRDIQPGDSIDVLYERYETEDGHPAGSGKIVYAALDLGNKTLKIYNHEDKSGDSQFYNELGESIRKALLKTPINGARLSSGFGMRTHPILGYGKMHKGVDFAAPTGTPIYASGDGVVTMAGRKGGYGNYVQIKHNNKYASAYAHLSRFASGITAGRKVRQGQVIAYVGSTGNSTGPHLHYEILVNGSQVNPNGVKFKTGNALAGNDLTQFKTRTVASVKTTLASLQQGQSTQVALSTSQVAPAKPAPLVAAKKSN